MIPLKNRTILTEHTQNNQIKEWLEIEIENKIYIYIYIYICRDKEKEKNSKEVIAFVKRVRD